jgi:DNA-binding transcriptional LysR family regulator
MIQFDRFKLKHLRQFVAVAEAGSISAGAEALFTSQPALSRSITEMEDALGDIRLFQRARKGVTLTRNGKNFMAFAQLVLSNFETFSANLVQDEGATGGTVRVGMGAYEGYTFLPNIMERVLNRRPDVQFNCMSGRFQDLINPLLQGQLDLIFGPVHSGPLPQGVKTFIVAQSKPSILVRSDHPLAMEPNVTLKMLSQQAWMVPVANTLPRRTFDEVFIKEGLTPPSGPMEISPSVLMIAMLRQRNLVGLVHPQLCALTSESAGLTELKLATNPFSWPVQLTTVNRHHPSAAVTETISLIKSMSKYYPCDDNSFDTHCHNKKGMDTV